MDLDLVQRLRKAEAASSPRRAAVRPTEINLTESWSTVRTQIIRTGSNAMETQSWNASPDTVSSGSMKVFTSMMLRAWRKRRADVQRLQLVVENLKTSAMQTRNELHVCNSLMRVEQKRCVDLQLELKKSNVSINQVRNSCDMLNTSLLSLTADKRQLEQQLEQCKQEVSCVARRELNKHYNPSASQCEQLKQQASKSKEELLAALLEHRNLQHQLGNEQRYTQHLIREKLRLEEELKQVERDFHSKLNENTLDLAQKQQQLHNMNSMVMQLEHQLKNGCIHNFGRTLPPLYGQQPRPVAELAVSTRRSLVEFIEYYGIDQFYTKVYSYAKHVAFVLWLAVLPRQSLRSGCMPSNQLRIMDQ
ncbi:hypothetical protein KR093_005769 [Drosophila rubida]|uniref:Uncharacterized protein n=1 Tax=Drosophila rubida TaxID=30044 RepID=A0AAD4PNH8_9MUSC|nr:hypothetical protein KR093_005769 [Drosophila rubida]